MTKTTILAPKLQKSKFILTGRKCPESHYMAGNEDLGYRRPISHQNLISKHVLDKFWENRKKSIFSTCHLWGQAKIMSKLTFSGRISAILYCGQVRTPQGCFPKKMWGFVDLSFVRNLFFVIFRQKSMILQNWAFQNILENPCHSWFFVADMLLF